MACAITMETNSVTAGGAKSPEQQTEEFYERLKPFPHLFQLQGYKDLTRSTLISIKSRIVAELKEFSDREYGPMQMCRDFNLIAFADYLLGDAESAKRESEKTLQKDSRNIVALANLAVFEWESGNPIEAKKKLETLEGMDSRDEKLVEGRAEMAYCYSRMGPRYIYQAIKLFEEVAFEEVEALRSSVHDWKLGLAMTLIRAIAPNQRMSYGTRVGPAIKKAHRAIDLLLDIRQSAEEKQIAEASAHLATLLASNAGHDYTLQNKIKQYCKSKSVSAEACIEDAERLAPNDAAILTKCGRYYHYTKQHKKAEEVLKKAISKRPTTVAHDLLGQIFFKKVVNYTFKTQQTETERNPTNKRPKQKKKHKKNRQVSANSPSTTEQDTFACHADESLHCTRDVGSVHHKMSSLSVSVDEHLPAQALTATSARSECRPRTARNVKKKTRRKSRRDKSPVNDSSTEGAGRITERNHSCESSSGDFQETNDDLKVQAAAREAKYHFKAGIELTLGENDKPRYHLAKLYMILGEHREALQRFSQLMGQKKSLNSPSTRLDACEGAAECYLKLSEQEDDGQKKAELRKEANKLLNFALSLQCHYARQVPLFQNYFGKYWQSFHTLMADVEGDNVLSTRAKQTRKAKLLHMIGKHVDTLQIIEDIKKVSGTDAIDPKLINMQLDCYLRSKQYDKAVAFLSLSSMTEQEDGLKGREKLFVQTHILAARQDLFACSDSDSACVCQADHLRNVCADRARQYLASAFELHFSPESAAGHAKKETLAKRPSTDQAQRRGQTTQEDNGEGEKDEEKEEEETEEKEEEADTEDRTGVEERGWHVMILYDQDDSDIEQKVVIIKKILTETCGLNVTSMSDDVHPGAHERSEILKNTEKSQVAVIMVRADDDTDYSIFRQLYLEPVLDILQQGDSRLRQLFILLTEPDNCARSRALSSDSVYPPSSDPPSRPSARVPSSLKLGQQLPVFFCPPVLLDPLGGGMPGEAEEEEGSTTLTKEKVYAICNLFCAMLGVSVREFL